MSGSKKVAQAISLVALLGLLAIASPARAAGGAATAAVKSSNDTIRGALKKMVAARGTPKWAEARTQARSAVGTLLDFEALAKSALGKHWDEVKPEQRKRYVEAMRSAIEAKYLSQMQGKVAVDDVKVDYLGEEAHAPNTLVHTHFTYGTDGAKIDFVVASEGGKHRAIDVITEDVGLAQTYRESIDGVWAKKGIEGVITSFEKTAKRLETSLESTQASTASAAAPAPAPSPDHSPKPK